MKTKTAGDLSHYCQTFFTDYLTQDRGLSRATFVAYASTMKLLLLFLKKKKGMDPDYASVSDLNSDLLLEFLRDLCDSRGNSSRTRNNRLSGIRTFFRFVAMKAPQYLELATAARLLPVKAKDGRERRLTYLTPDELEAVLRSVDQSNFVGRRTHMLIRLAASTGLRNSEITHLERKNIVFGSNSFLRLTGKGRKERDVFLESEVRAALKEWLKEVPNEPEALVFANRNGSRLSPDAIRYAVSRYVEIARKTCPSLADKHVTPHVLRHTAAMVMLAAGLPIPAIAIYLGHESIKTTLIYLHHDRQFADKLIENAPRIPGHQQAKPLDGATLSFLTSLCAPSSLRPTQSPSVEPGRN